MKNNNIEILSSKLKAHAKAAEEFVSVRFQYPETGDTWEGWVPVVYRRTGLSLQAPDDIEKHLEYVYAEMHPSKRGAWKASQEAYWSERKAQVTKSFYDKLAEGGWKCRACALPINPNFARRIQELKEMGYTIATDTKRFCSSCNTNTTHLLLLPIPRADGKSNGYETWSPALRKRIAKVLGQHEVYDDTVNRHGCPDHKFSEIRWDAATKAENPDTMTDAQIRRKFQWLTNQHNLQKKMVCLHCFETGERGSCFGIRFFYKGGPQWDARIPQQGKAAEKGCVGCPWYDLAEWRKHLIKKLMS